MRNILERELRTVILVTDLRGLVEGMVGTCGPVDRAVVSEAPATQQAAEKSMRTNDGDLDLFVVDSAGFARILGLPRRGLSK
jgi:hypothetical protein